jgi:Mannosylglycerate hydrolase MGH1-like glycoside hydrolase domain/Glycosyl hydrolase family 63 C-terminal domain
MGRCLLEAEDGAASVILPGSIAPGLGDEFKGFGPSMTAEEKRLEESRQREGHWKRWGPYLAERQWGTVREDYSPDGTAWEYFPHDHARSRAFRWGEDGIAGICDRHQYICFALALWNRRDPILKERLFGLTGKEGNHGEDVKEYYFYLDSTPTHSYMKYLYKYPQAEFPYTRLVEENRRRGRESPEYELIDTGVFSGGRYFDVFIEYAKATEEDILVRITAWNRGPEAAELHLLPTLWFRNRWSWGRGDRRPSATKVENPGGPSLVRVLHDYYGERWLAAEGAPELLFTENETNFACLYGVKNGPRGVKDAVNDAVIHGKRDAVNPREGTKVAANYRLAVPAGGSVALRLRFTNQEPEPGLLEASFNQIFAQRIREAEEFYQTIIPGDLMADCKNVMRQALAGMLWSKQFYHYDVRTWLEGDPPYPPPPPERWKGRNHQWIHLYNNDVLSIPDKWEYPWYAAWDLAFHCITLALVDPDFAKEQLILLLREWYMHPNGELPAYEWALGDVNPPVHAWAAWRVYKIEQKRCGKADRIFLERVFHKLLLYFTWWVNRKDPQGNNVFEGGFLGLDNIGIFDRSKPLPMGGFIEQSDGTSWMAMFCLNMLVIAFELAKEDPAYEDVASKFFEHFVYIADAMNNRGGEGIALWNEEDGFYYDVLHLADAQHLFMRVRSMVGLIPLFAVQPLEPELVDRFPGFKGRMQWFLDNHPNTRNLIDASQSSGPRARRLLSIATRERLLRVLKYMLDENEFLSPFGIRSLSRYHLRHPYVLSLDGDSHAVDYEPAESTTGVFGGNSNWRGPVWFPVNFLLIESLQKYHHYFGEQLKVECPTGSGKMLTLWEIAGILSRRLCRIFLRDANGRRPVYGGTAMFQTDPHWRDLILFYEYFHGDNGAGIGASHQTGWTGLVAKLLQQSGRGC